MVARMRAYLSSYQLGDHPGELAALVTGERRGWVVMNALDAGDEARRRTDVQWQIAALAELGLHADELDLRSLTPDRLAHAMGAPDFLWVRGGNAFVLRMAWLAPGSTPGSPTPSPPIASPMPASAPGPASSPPPCTASSCATHPRTPSVSTVRCATTPSACSTGPSSRIWTPPATPNRRCWARSPVGTGMLGARSGPFRTARRSSSTRTRSPSAKTA